MSVALGRPPSAVHHPKFKDFMGWEIADWPEARQVILRKRDGV
jgi:hypothetical protein